MGWGEWEGREMRAERRPAAAAFSTRPRLDQHASRTPRDPASMRSACTITCIRNDVAVPCCILAIRVMTNLQECAGVDSGRYQMQAASRQMPRRQYQACPHPTASMPCNAAQLTQPCMRHSWKQERKEDRREGGRRRDSPRVPARAARAPAQGTSTRRQTAARRPGLHRGALQCEVDSSDKKQRAWVGAGTGPASRKCPGSGRAWMPPQTRILPHPSS